MTQRIMVVDDDSNLRQALKYRLEREMYDVDLAADGSEALRKVNTERPDAIILDLAMPHMNGLEFLGRLRDDPHTLSIPVIILTAVGLDACQASREGLDLADLIMKPFSTHRLISAVKRALQVSSHGEAACG